jgi:sodium/pantothenate symporter
MASAGDDHLAEPAGVWRAGSRIPVAAGVGLYWERANAAGALSAMIVGGVLYAVLATFKIQYLGFHPIVPSLLLSLLAFVVGNRFGQPSHNPL